MERPHQLNSLKKNRMGPHCDNHLWYRIRHDCGRSGESYLIIDPYLDNTMWWSHLSDCQMTAASVMVMVTKNAKECVVILDRGTIIDLIMHHLVVELGLLIWRMRFPLELKVAGVMIITTLGEVTFNLRLAMGWAPMPCMILIISNGGDTSTIAPVILGIDWQVRLAAQLLTWYRHFGEPPLQCIWWQGWT